VGKFVALFFRQLRQSTGGPYVNGGLSIVVLTFVVAAGIATVGYADKSISSISLAPLYFLPLALSALVHPLRVSLMLSVVCLGLHVSNCSMAWRRDSTFKRCFRFDAFGILHLHFGLIAVPFDFALPRGCRRMYWKCALDFVPCAFLAARARIEHGETYDA